jgi:pectin methylesterase-like acyl-CoA thioesterase
MNLRRWTLSLFGMFWLIAAGGCASHELVVAADGTGQFTTVQSALDSIPSGGSNQVTIHVKPGIYTEAIVIDRNKPPIRIWGDAASATVLTFNLQANARGPDGKKIGTFKTASTVVQANDFEADEITFANSTPRDISQALAISCLADRQIYRRCRFLGWQDTIYTNGGPPPGPVPTRTSFVPATAPLIPATPYANRLYFEDCFIEGGVDFIFGNSTAVFNRCEIHSKRHGYLTAASTPHGVPFGYVFMNCKLTAAPDVINGTVYLGRPWREYANVVYLNCWMGPHISPAGWSEWKSAPQRIYTVRYAEYHSTGPGATPEHRVKWSHQLTDGEAGAITVESVLGGDDHWMPDSSSQP